MKIVMFANGSSENHGCEAIKKGTLSILGENDYIIGTTKIDYEPSDDGIRYIPYDFKKKYSILTRLMCRLKLMHNPKGKLQLSHFKPIFDECDIALSVGGDNYCYGDNDWLYYLHNLALEAGKPNILWGVSIEGEQLDEDMLSDLQKFDKIIARESITYNTLKDRGLSNVVLFPDPAFALAVKTPDVLDDGFNENKSYIGINISPLVERKEVTPGIIRENVNNLINRILNETDYDVMLVPHVVTGDNNDYELLSSIKTGFETDRVVLIKDHPCEELKYYISRCNLFLAARTHASIAAYSMGVPTLVIGYSVKSRGIATDLFGKTEGFVLPVGDIDESTKLCDAFFSLMSRQDEVKACLDEKMPEYVKKTYEMKDVVLNCIGKR